MTKPAASHALPQRGKWVVFLGMGLIAAFIALFPQELLRYERQSIFFHEPWRWLTAHLVHLGPAHLFLNFAGLALICELFWRDLPVRHGVAVLAIAGGSIATLLWFFHPQVQWYAGLSGVAHALWAAGVSATLSQPQAIAKEKHRFTAIAGGIFLLMKLVGERTGFLFSFVTTEGFPVLDIAHTYGALTGVAYVLLWRQGQNLTRRK